MTESEPVTGPWDHGSCGSAARADLRVQAPLIPVASATTAPAVLAPITGSPRGARARSPGGLGRVTPRPQGAPNGGGGRPNGVPAAPGGTSTVTASVISNNTSNGTNPGGIYNNRGTVNLRLTVVVANTPSNCVNSPTAVPGCIG